MYIPDNVFILEQNSYKSFHMKSFVFVKNDKSYEDKCFFAWDAYGGIQNDYVDFYQARRRQKYMYERSIKNKEISYDMFTTDE